MINLSPVSLLQKTNLFVSNPINFKGGVKEAPFDTFEKQDADNSEESLIAEAKKKIEQSQEEIKKLSCKIENLKKENAKSKASNRFLINIDVQSLKYQISDLEKYCDKLNIYIEHLKTHFKTAFLYNPDISCQDKFSKASELENAEMCSLNALSQKLGISRSMLKSYVHFDFLPVDTVVNNHYSSLYLIDYDYEPVKKFISRIEENKDNIITSDELLTEYNFSEAQASKLIREGKLVTLFGEGSNSKSFLINPNEETNVKTIQEHLKIYPLRSEKYFRSWGYEYDKFLVPAPYLSKLGFGTVKELHEAIKKGVLKGKIEKTDEGKIRVYVDLAPKEAEYELQLMRKQNKNIKTVKELAKMLNLKTEDIEQALIIDKLSIFFVC